MRHGTSEALRRANLSAVLTLLVRGGPSSRSELARASGRNRSTIGSLVADLVAMGLVAERDPEPAGHAGRPSPVVSLRPDVAAISVYPEIDVLRVTLVGLDGTFLDDRRRDFDHIPAPEEVIAASAALIGECRRAASGVAVVGIGAAIPGQVRALDGVVRTAPHLRWTDVPFGELLGRATGLPVQVANDASLGALAEHDFGAGRIGGDGARSELAGRAGGGDGGGSELAGRAGEREGGRASGAGSGNVLSGRAGGREAGRASGAGSGNVLSGRAGGREAGRGSGVGIGGGGPLVYLNGGASGIGGGVVVGGTLLGGAHGYAGELGHARVSSSEVRDSAGIAGTLEAMVTRAELQDVLGLKGADADGLHRALLADRSARVRRVVERQVGHLAHGLATCVSILNPQVIVLGGFLASLLEYDSARLHAAVAEATLRPSVEGVAIVASQLGSRLLPMGAAHLAFGPLLREPAAVMGSR